MQTVSFHVNPDISAQAIVDLRIAVGWDDLPQDYPAALKGYWGYIGGFDEAGTLVAWCAILSDGIRHAVLLDVIVHPAWQRQGVGSTMIAQALNHIRSHDITIVHVDFLPEYAAFYERCGFQVGLGSIMEL